LWEKVARKARRMRGLSAETDPLTDF
jgi:hypothetical protein